MIVVIIIVDYNFVVVIRNNVRCNTKGSTVPLDTLALKITTTTTETTLQ